MQQPKRTSTQTVLEAVEDLHARQVIVTRESVADVTGMKLSVVDDRLKTLVTDELILRLGRGIYRPKSVYPPARLVTVTHVPGGPIKIEVGDEVLTVTADECKSIAILYAGTPDRWAGHISAERPITRGILEDGYVTMEIGEQALRLTPREDRNLATLICGAMTQAVAIELGDRTAQIVSDFSRRLRTLEAELEKAYSLAPEALELLDFRLRVVESRKRKRSKGVSEDQIQLSLECPEAVSK